MTVLADADVCVGAGQCALSAPDVFDQDDDGLVVVLEQPEGAEALAQAKEAVRLCPARALRIAEG